MIKEGIAKFKEQGIPAFFDGKRTILARNPFNQWPPTLKCFCGSKKQFRKCHRPKMGPAVRVDDYKKLEANFNFLLNALGDSK